MVESTENAEAFLAQLIDYTSLALDIIVAIIIIIIVGITLAGLVRILLSSLKKKEEEGEQRPTLVHQLVTRMLRGLLIALDFLVAADILKTILVPSADELAILVIIVAIRILLSWSLSKEIENQPRMQ